MKRQIPRILLFLMLGLVTTLALAWVLAATVDVQQGPNTAADAFIANEHWSVSRYDRAGAVQVRSTRRVGLNWSPQQAAGAPDTPNPGDQVTAWASLGSDSQSEWLLLDYAKPVIAREVHVYENCSPGALYKVTLFTQDDQELTAWTGTDPTPQNAPAGVSKIPVSLDVKTSRVKLYIASDKFPGWNEVDAVALIDSTGQTQWAKRVQASSTYATAGSRSVASGAGNPALLLPPWADLDKASRAMESGELNFEDRLVDARGWPMLALYSEQDMTVRKNPPVLPSTNTPIAPAGLSLGGDSLGGPQFVTGGRVLTSRTGTLSGVSAVITPSSGGPVPMPLRPIWSGLLVNVAIYATAWYLLYLAATAPRRFFRETSRFRKGCCIQCGYDLGYDFIQGCPECGWRRDRAPTGSRHTDSFGGGPNGRASPAKANPGTTNQLPSATTAESTQLN
jgi:hypothetical protein